MSAVPDTRLPHGLIATYHSYKQGTRTILNWLKDNAPRRKKNLPSNLPLHKWVKLAEVIAGQDKRLSPDLAFIFKRTIEERDALSTYFEDHVFAHASPSSSTAQHRWFTHNLRRIYEMLPKQPPEPLEKKDANLGSRGKAKQKLRPKCSNPFELLAKGVAETQISSAPRDTTVENEPFPETTAEGTGSGSEKKVDCIADDDGLAETMEAFLAMLSIDAGIDLVRSYWSASSRGEIPFAVASALSLQLWEWIQDDVDVLAQSCHGDNFLESFRAKQSLFEKIGKTSDGASQPFDRLCTLSYGLTAPMEVLDRAQTLHQNHQLHGLFQDPLIHESIMTINHENATTTNREEPIDVSQFPVHIHANARFDISTMATMLYEGVINTICSPLAEPAAIPTKEHTDQLFAAEDRGPVDFLELKFHRLIHDGPRVNKRAFFGCAVGLRFMVEGKRGFQLSGNREQSGIPTSTLLRRPSAWLETMRFLIETDRFLDGFVTHEVLTAFCARSLLQKCWHLKHRIKLLLGLRMDDVNMSNPLTAGRILLKIHDETQTIGVRFCNYCQHVASILHVYNAMYATREIQPILVLDQLCILFRNSVFVGSIPKSSFLSAFVIFRRGKISYSAYGRNGSEYIRSLGGTDRVGLMVPSPAEVVKVDGEARESNWKRFDETVDNSTFRLSQRRGVDKTTWYWCKVLDQPEWTRPTKANHRFVSDWMDSTDFDNHPIKRVEKAMMEEFSPGSRAPGDVRDRTSPRGPKDDTHKQKRARLATPKIHAEDQRPANGGPSTKPPPISSSEAEMERERRLQIPIPKVNYMKVWTKCADAFLRMNNGYMRDDRIEAAFYSLCLVEDMLDSLDDVVLIRKFMRRGFAMPLWTAWREALNSTFRDLKVEDLCWKSL